MADQPLEPEYCLMHHPPCVRVNGEWQRRNALGDPCCEHGVAMDVHCCNCHSGFLFDPASCTCLEAKD